MCSVFFEAFRMRLNIIAMLLHFYCTLDYRSSLQMNRGKSALSCTAQWASYCFLFCTLKHPDFATTVIGSQQHCTLRLLHCLICKKIMFCQIKYLLKSVITLFSSSINVSKSNIHNYPVTLVEPAWLWYSFLRYEIDKRLRAVYCHISIYLEGNPSLVQDVGFAVSSLQMGLMCFATQKCTIAEWHYIHCSNAQCALWAVRWPCSILAIAVKTLSHVKTIVLRLFFLYCCRKKTLKLVLLFIFRH